MYRSIRSGIKTERRGQNIKDRSEVATAAVEGDDY